MRADTQRHERNLQVRSELKTLTRRFKESLKGGKKEEVQQIYRLLTKTLDQAAKRNVLHKNTASRKVSRLGRLAHKVQK